MWDPNTAPTASFEEAAKVLGLKRARSLWAYYDLQWKRKEQEADAIELALAQRAQAKDYVWNEEIGGAPVARYAPHTYLKLWRASLPQKGCSGGEYLEDEDYMKYFLKTNPQCAVNARSPHIRGAWTPALERAAWQGKQEREGSPVVAGSKYGGTPAAA